MNYKWSSYNEGKSIGEICSEQGEILLDEENSFGARITLEKNGSIAPFSITIGIYGLMFHTDFYSSSENAKNEFKNFKNKIDKVIVHYSIEENSRDSEWNIKLNQLTELITN